MRPSPSQLFCAVLLASTGACASTSPVHSGAVLPLRSVRLYETGVGYFERSGVLSSTDGMTLPVPAGHLDDALETLVVLGASGGTTVRGITFSSSLSRGMARAIAGLPVEGDETLDLQALLVGLKGARVTVETHERTWRGRVVEVVPGVSAAAPGADTGDAAKAKDPSDKKTFAIVLLGDGGAVVRIPSASVETVRPLDPAWAGRLGSALDALSSKSARAAKELRVLAGGGGPVTLGYVAETPVWRTTYRFVEDDAGTGGVLEGWALVHNDTDEDWRGVQVELANGRPDSFLFPLAAPRYARRDLVAPSDRLATVPQLVDTTADALWGDQVGDAFGGGGGGLVGTGEGGGGRGEGIGLGSIGTIGHGVGSADSTVLSVGNLAATAPASGDVAGALFVYRPHDRVDLPARGSALVPFADARVDAVSITWIDGQGTTARSGVRFVNSTARTLPAGTIAFFSHGGFAGETTLPRLLPAERRFLTYGVDLDVEATRWTSKAHEETKRLLWRETTGTLEEHTLKTTDFTLSLENRASRPRKVVVALDLSRNGTLTGPDEVDFDEASGHPLAVFDAPAGSSKARTMRAVEGLVHSTPLPELTGAKLSGMAASPGLEASDRGAATEAAQRLTEAEASAKAAADATAEIAELEKDMTRIREHMKALPSERAGGPAQENPFAKRLLAAEDKLTTLRARAAAARADEKTKRTAAQAALGRLSK